MQITTQIICPNCGSPDAERYNLVERELSRTQCHDCDYLLVTCQRTNRVIEAYAPGIDLHTRTAGHLRQRSPVINR